MKNSKESVLETYIQLARKLNKLPSTSDLARFADMGRDTVRHFYTNITVLKEKALAQEPSLANMVSPAPVSIEDIKDFRTQLANKKLNKDNSNLTGDASFLRYVEKLSDQIFSGRVVVTTPKFKKKQTKRVINLALSDLHIGADIHKEETGNLTFGRIEEARRLASIIAKTCNFKRDRRGETELNLFLLGDIIQGMLGHDPRDGAELAEQYCRAMHLLVQALGILASEFKLVTVYCTSGNHDRNSARHPGRAIHGRYDSFSTMLYYSLKKSFDDVKNVKFVIPKTPYVVAEALGRKIFIWHGDTGIKTGNVGNSINVANIEKQVNKINASLDDDQEYEAFVHGHLHTGNIAFLSNGAAVISNGGLPPVDAFGVSLGIHEANCGQMLFESTEDMVVGDVRFLRVGKEDDENKELDKLIKPWSNFEDKN